MTKQQFERARTAEAKHLRETAILEAATALAGERSIRAVTLTDIAAEVGMHKSAMLRYFETREEIFLRLAASAWTDWSREVRDRLGRLDGLDGLDADHAAEPATRIAAVAGILSESLTGRPLFCDLIAHTPLNLERGVSFEAVRTFKVVAIAEATAIAQALCEVLPLTEQQSANVVATATVTAGAFWQMAAPGTELRRFYQDSPDLAHAVIDVAPRLIDILTALLRGYLADGSDAA